MTRKEILEMAEKMINGSRQDDYGKPENSFRLIAEFWSAYLYTKTMRRRLISPTDVASMMALLKIARVAGGHGKSDNWIDLAGYAACGGELEATGTATREGEDE